MTTACVEGELRNMRVYVEWVRLSFQELFKDILLTPVAEEGFENASLPEAPSVRTFHRFCARQQKRGLRFLPLCVSGVACEGLRVQANCTTGELTLGAAPTDQDEKEANKKKRKKALFQSSDGAVDALAVAKEAKSLEEAFLKGDLSCLFSHSTV